MKKGINKSILFYVVSALFLIASAIGLTTGNENTMAIIWLSLGSAFLCLGSTYKKKENNKTIQMINNFMLVLLENRDSSSPFVICNCWLTDLQPEMVECKQQNCYI